MRKTVSIAVLLVILFDAGGMIFGLQIRQWIHKAAIAAIMNSENLSTEILTIRLSKSQFDQIKIHEREFKLHGQMYDIVWRESDGGDLILYCYRDIAEEKMIAKFLGFLANKTKENTPAATVQEGSAVFGFVLSLPENGYILPALSGKENTVFSLLQSTIHLRKRIDLPPPRLSSL